MSAKKPAAEKISSKAPFGLRMPTWLREKVEQAAAKNNRSMNAEIVATLEIGLRRHEMIFDLDGMVTEMSALRELIEAKDETIRALREAVDQTQKNASPATRSKSPKLTEAEKEELWEWMLQRAKSQQNG